LKFELKDRKERKEEILSESQSQLGPAISLKGDLTCDENLAIHGEFQGKIDMKNNDLTIEREGKVKADVMVKDINVQGRLNGNIYASGKVSIGEQGRVTGDIFAARISISDGAQVKGSLKMGKDIEKEFFPKEKIKPLFEEEKDLEEAVISPENIPE